MNQLYQISSPYFCAGITVGEDGKVTADTAPILRWAVGRPWPFVRLQFASKNWHITPIKNRTDSGPSELDAPPGPPYTPDVRESSPRPNEREKEIEMGLFAGIEDAKPTQGGNYLKPGTHTVQILRLTVGKTRKNVDFFAADLKLLGTNSEEHSLNDTVNWFVGFDKEPALANVKAFAKAVLSNALPEGEEFDESSITEEVMDSLVSENGKAVQGQKLQVQVVLVPTKSGGQFSRHLWFPERGLVSNAA